MTTKRKKFRIRHKPKKPKRQLLRGSLPGYLSLNTDFDEKWQELQKEFTKTKPRDFKKYNKDLDALYSEYIGTSDPEVIRFFKTYDVTDAMDGLSLDRLSSIFSDIREILKNWGIDKTALDIDIGGGGGCCCHDDPASIQLIVWHEEPDHMYENNLKRYESRLKRYNKWYEKNEEKINEELALREQES